MEDEIKASIIPSQYGQYYVPPKIKKVPRPEAGIHESLKTADEQFEGGMSYFRINRLLGRGNYCEVVKATYELTGTEYAIKIINKVKCQQTKHTLDVLMEKHVLSRLRNELYYNVNDPQVFPFPLVQAFMRDGEKLYIVQEILEGGEVWETVKSYGCLYYPRAVSILAQIIMALKKLHQMQIVHRDLKLENVMFRNPSMKQMRSNSIALIDFGTALDLSRPDLEGGGNTSRGRNGVKFHHWVGTSNFMPPEAVHNRHSDLRNDLWSLGCLVFQLFSGYPPFQSPSDFLTFIKSGYKMIDYPLEIPEQVKDLIESLIQFEPSQRLGAGNEERGEAKSIDWEVIMEHPVFDEIEDWTSVELISDPFHSTFRNKLMKQLQENNPSIKWLNDYSIAPSLSDLEKLVSDELLIAVIAQLCEDRQYRNECIQCQARRSVVDQSSCPSTISISELYKTLYLLSCEECESNTARKESAKPLSSWKYMKHSARRCIEELHRRWRDVDREDSYWEELSNEYMRRNPLSKKNNGKENDDDTSG